MVRHKECFFSISKEFGSEKEFPPSLRSLASGVVWDSLSSTRFFSSSIEYIFYYFISLLNSDSEILGSDQFIIGFIITFKIS
jgi:hypothetical protein